MRNDANEFYIYIQVIEFSFAFFVLQVHKVNETFFSVPFIFFYHMTMHILIA